MANKNCVSCGMMYALDKMRRVYDTRGRLVLRCVQCLKQVAKRNKELGLAKTKHLRLPDGQLAKRALRLKVTQDVRIEHPIPRTLTNYFVFSAGLRGSYNQEDLLRGPLTRDEAYAVCRQVRVCRVAEMLLPNTQIWELPSGIAERARLVRGFDWVHLGYELASWIKNTQRAVDAT